MKRLLAITLSVALIIPAGITLAGSEEICATWINTEYHKGIHHRKLQKTIFTPDGTLREYRGESLPSPDWKGTYTITEKWTDSEEDIWYKIKVTEPLHGGLLYFLARISDSGKTLEFVCHPVDYHKELEPKHPSYPIYYRKYEG